VRESANCQAEYGGKTPNLNDSVALHKFTSKGESYYILNLREKTQRQTWFIQMD
jgi:hypothetical protein